MKKAHGSPFYIFIIALICFSLPARAQDGFLLKEGREKDKIRFKMVNNLPVVPVEVNGTKLSFILDTGVKSTILFSLEKADSLWLNEAVSVRLHGLGSGESVEALKSGNNFLKVGDATDKNHTLYVIFDRALNFSPRMGIPIHGILGNDFFKNFVVKINYGSEKITLYKADNYTWQDCRKCTDFDLVFENGKPYVEFEVIRKDTAEAVTLLIDSGSSDALWLFDSKDLISENPRNYFEDFLGLGLGGNIFGKRSKINRLRISDVEMQGVNASFPNADAIRKARAFEERDGSIGGGLLSRFTVVLDYGNKKMRLKKNRFFNDPFHYNMSGLTLEHEGMELVRQQKESGGKSRPSGNIPRSAGVVDIPVAIEYEFNLVPRYVVAEVLENSPAALSGIEKGDEITRINGKPAHAYELYELIELFSKNEGKRIIIEVEREGLKLKKKFFLQKML